MPAVESCARAADFPRSWFLFWSLSYLVVRCVPQIAFLRAPATEGSWSVYGAYVVSYAQAR